MSNFSKDRALPVAVVRIAATALLLEATLFAALWVLMLCLIFALAGLHAVYVNVDAIAGGLNKLLQPLCDGTWSVAYAASLAALGYLVIILFLLWKRP